jgi:hypothetical protein
MSPCKKTVVHRGACCAGSHGPLVASATQSALTGLHTYSSGPSAPVGPRAITHEYYLPVLTAPTPYLLKLPSETLLGWERRWR